MEALVSSFVMSAATIIQPRGRPLSPTMTAMREVDRALRPPGKPVWKLSWRLPQEISESYIVQPFLDICERQAVATKFCMEDLLEIP